jgi:hypothetical protein
MPQLNPSTNMLWSVLSRSGLDLAFFSIILGIMFFAFSLVALQMFGTKLLECECGGGLD